MAGTAMHKKISSAYTNNDAGFNRRNSMISTARYSSAPTRLPMEGNCGRF